MIGGYCRNHVADPSQQSAAANPQPRRDDQPEDAAKEITVVELTDARKDRAENGGSPRIPRVRYGFLRSTTTCPPFITHRTCFVTTVMFASGSPSRPATTRSEEHTSELQSRLHLVCRLLLEKKKKTNEYPSRSLRHA